MRVVVIFAGYFTGINFLFISPNDKMTYSYHIPIPNTKRDNCIVLRQ